MFFPYHIDPFSCNDEFYIFFLFAVTHSKFHIIYNDSDCLAFSFFHGKFFFATTSNLDAEENVRIHPLSIAIRVDMYRRL